MGGLPADGSAGAGPSRAARTAWLALAFAPALACGLLVARHAVDVPVWDDWERAKLIAAWKTGHLDWHTLYAPHIDHRIVVPRLVALFTARVFGGSLLPEIALSWVVLLVTAVGVHALLRRTFPPERPAARYGLTFLANGLLFTPLQWENLLWAAQPFFLWPLAAVVLALLVLGSRLRIGVRLALCLVLAVVTTHTFSHGLPLWALVPAGVLLRRDFGPARARVAFLAVWLVAAAAVLVPYFTVDGMRSASEPSHAFEMPTGQRAPGLSLAPLAHEPVKVRRFFTTMLGSPFARTRALDPRAVAGWAGAGVLLAFAVPALWWALRWRDPELWARGLPWVLLGGYALGVCAVAAVGRTAMSQVKWSYALLPHYVSISVHVVVAALPLAALALEDLRRRAGPGWRPLLDAAGPCAAGFLAVACGLGWLEGRLGMREWESARLQERTSLMYLLHFPPRQIRRMDGSRELVERFAPLLDGYGLLHPPLLHEPTLAPFAIDPQPLARETAYARARADGGRVRVTGYAWLPAGDRRADGVLLATTGPDGALRAVGLAELEGFPRFFVPEHDHIFNEVHLPDASDFGRFSGRVELAALPPGPRHTVTPYAVDARRMRLYPFGERFEVRWTPEGVAVGRPDEGAP